MVGLHLDNEVQAPRLRSGVCSNARTATPYGMRSAIIGRPDGLKQQISLYQKLGLGSTHETCVFDLPCLHFPAVSDLPSYELQSGPRG